MRKDKTGKVALAKVRDFSLYEMDSRLDTTEGKISTLESQVAALMSQMASHTHGYTDDGAAKTTSAPNT